MPLGIIGSLLIASVVYVSVTLVVTGMVPFTEITNTDQHMAAPLVYAFKFVGDGWATMIISVGSLLGLTTATLTCLFGQPRIFYRMAVDVSQPQQRGAAMGEARSHGCCVLFGLCPPCRACCRRCFAN